MPIDLRYASAGSEPVAKFYALPVKEGDSFVLVRSDASILVDGGVANKDRWLASLLQSQCGVSKLDIVVCTHNDDDHTGGLVAFLF